jgi:hypothetical protein
MIVVPAATADGAQSADSAATLYVNQLSAGCSDSGPGTQAVPFCSIQAAADMVNPGQTVDIEGKGPPGGQIRYAPVTITRSGTPSAPITFAGTLHLIAGVVPAIFGSTPLVTLKDVHDVTISSLDLYSNAGTADGIDVVGSQDITLDHLTVEPLIASGSPAGVSIDGVSSAVTVSRSRIGGYATALRVESGAQNVTATTNFLTVSNGTGISVDGAAGDLTSNTVRVACGTAAAITGATTAVVENNIFEVGTGCTTPGTGLSVDAASAGNVRADYNALFAPGTNTEYSWAGTTYSTAAGFSAATGQGAHDADMTQFAGTVPNQASLVDSADCAAPGELATDLLGNPRVDDPLVTNTGNGTCYADRGAYELEDGMAFSVSTTPTAPAGPAPFTVGVTVTPGATLSTWGETVTYSVDFGDGTAPQPAPAGQPLTHTYTTPGQYILAVTASDTGGTTRTVRQQVSVGPPAPAVAVGAEGGDGQMWVQAPQLGGGWHSLGGKLSAPPAVAAPPNPNGVTPAQPLFIAASTNRMLYIRSLAVGWQPLGSAPGGCYGSPAAVIIGTTLTVACRGANNALWENSAAVPSSGLPQFTGAWTSLGGSLTAGPAVAPVGGTLWFFARGPNGHIFTRTLASGFKQMPWACIGSPAAAEAASGDTIFACQGQDRTLDEAHNSGTGWSSAVSLGGQLIGGPAVAATTESTDLLAEGPHQAVWQWTALTGWTSLGGVVVGGVGAVALN